MLEKSVELIKEVRDDPLISLCRDGDVEAVAEILHPLISVEVFMRLNQKDKTGISAIAWACRNGHTEIIRIILECNKLTSDQVLNLFKCQTIYKTTAFAFACRLGHRDIVQIILDKLTYEQALELVSMKTIKFPGDTGDTALTEACEGNHGDIVQIILAKFNDDDAIDLLFSRNWEGRTMYSAISNACRRGFVDVVRAIVERVKPSKALELLRDYDSRTLRSPLIYAAIGGHLNVIQFILDKFTPEECMELMRFEPGPEEDGTYRNILLLYLDANGADILQAILDKLTPEQALELLDSVDKELNSLLLNICQNEEITVEDVKMVQLISQKITNNKDFISLVAGSDLYRYTTLAHLISNAVDRDNEIESESSYDRMIEILQMILDRFSSSDEAYDVLSIQCDLRWDDCLVGCIDSDFNDKLTALMFAAEDKRGDMINMILQTVNYQHALLLLQQKSETGKTAFMALCSHNTNIAIRILKEAFKRGDVDKVRDLLSDSKEDGRTVLMSACIFNDIAFIKAILGMVSDDLAAELLRQKDESGETALMHACRKENIAAIEVILEAVSDDLAAELLRQKDKTGISAIDWACITGHTEIIRIILECNKLTSDQVLNLFKCQTIYEPTAFAFACRLGRRDIVQIILDKLTYEQALELVSMKTIKFPGDTGDTALTEACEGNHGDIVQIILAKFNDDDAIDLLFSRNWEGRTMYSAISNACRRGFVDVVRAIVERVKPSKALELLRDYDSRTLRSPLIYAAIGGHLNVIQFILDKFTPEECMELMRFEPDPEMIGVYYDTLLSHLDQNDSDILQAILDKLSPEQAFELLNSVDADCNSLLVSICSHEELSAEHVKIVQAISQKITNNELFIKLVTRFDPDFFTALTHLSANSLDEESENSYEKRIEIFKMILDRCSSSDEAYDVLSIETDYETNINHDPYGEYTVLMFAADCKSDDMIKIILQKVNYKHAILLLQQKDVENEKTAFMSLCLHHINIAIWILEEAFKRGDVDRVRDLLSDSNKDGRTVLMSACIFNDIAFIKAILGMVSDDLAAELLRQKDESGETALMHACRKENIAAIEVILEAVSDDLAAELLCQKDESGISAFSFAKTHKSIGRVIQEKFSPKQFDDLLREHNFYFQYNIISSKEHDEVGLDSYLK